MMTIQIRVPTVLVCKINFIYSGKHIPRGTTYFMLIFISRVSSRTQYVLPPRAQHAYFTGQHLSTGQWVLKPVRVYDTCIHIGANEASAQGIENTEQKRVLHLKF